MALTLSHTSSTKEKVNFRWNIPLVLYFRCCLLSVLLEHLSWILTSPLMLYQLMSAFRYRVFVCVFLWVWWLVWSSCLLRLCVVRQTDRQGWTDRLWQAKQQVCLLNVTRHHTNTLFTFSLLILVFISKRKDFSSSLSLTVFHLWERQTTPLSVPLCLCTVSPHWCSCFFT